MSAGKLHCKEKVVCGHALVTRALVQEPKCWQTSDFQRPHCWLLQRRLCWLSRLWAGKPFPSFKTEEFPCTLFPWSSNSSQLKLSSFRCLIVYLTFLATHLWVFSQTSGGFTVSSYCGYQIHSPDSKNSVTSKLMCLTFVPSLSVIQWQWLHTHCAVLEWTEPISELPAPQAAADWVNNWGFPISLWTAHKAD